MTELMKQLQQWAIEGLVTGNPCHNHRRKANKMLELLKKWFTLKEKPIRYTITIGENCAGNMRLEGVNRCGKHFYLSQEFASVIYPLILHLATIENAKKGN